MLMDDTVILATSKERCMEKLNVLMDFCQHSGMIINEGKTKFMAVNGKREDKQAMHVSSSDQSLNYKIEHCEQYTYLGAIFTADGSTVSKL
jgi:hypothetical protein